MRGYGKHIIAIRFLSAIIVGLIFAFLIVFVFPAVEDGNISLSRLEIDRPLSPENLNKEDDFTDLVQKKEEGKILQLELKDKAKKRSSELMETAKNSSISVITINHIEKINGKREKYEMRLKEYRSSLANEYEEKTASREKVLEEELMDELENLRRKLKQKYKNLDSQILLSNYNKILNLRIQIEVVAEEQEEIEKLNKKLRELREEQNKILQQKNQKYNQEIEERADVLINKYNQNFVEFQENIKKEHQNLLVKKESELQQELDNFIAEQRRLMNQNTTEKAEKLDRLAEESLKNYY